MCLAQNTRRVAQPKAVVAFAHTPISKPGSSTRLAHHNTKSVAASKERRKIAVPVRSTPADAEAKAVARVAATTQSVQLSALFSGGPHGISLAGSDEKKIATTTTTVASKEKETAAASANTADAVPPAAGSPSTGVPSPAKTSPPRSDDKKKAPNFSDGEVSRASGSYTPATPSFPSKVQAAADPKDAFEASMLSVEEALSFLQLPTGGIVSMPRQSRLKHPFSLDSSPSNKLDKDFKLQQQSRHEGKQHDYGPKTCECHFHTPSPTVSVSFTAVGSPPSTPRRPAGRRVISLSETTIPDSLLMPLLF